MPHPMRFSRVRPPWPLALLFVSAGLTHFLRPEVFDAVVPPWVPLEPRTATLISGAAELAGGLGLLLPATRPAASWGLIALLLAVFPANIYMAQHPERYVPIPAWALWLRLPLQAALIWWVWNAGRVRNVEELEGAEAGA
ncbi:DoxX family protein [Deinococcus sp.]|uniref:DoxX family protein n=1 Tax=Deinococcus sp. TaxID=47478 RepID=UPI0025D4F8DF|nr:DoxX family protein [Deinococcus sp.]